MTAILSGVIWPQITFCLRLGFFMSPRFEIRLLTRCLYLLPVSRNSPKICKLLVKEIVLHRWGKGRSKGGRGREGGREGREEGGRRREGEREEGREEEGREEEGREEGGREEGGREEEGREEEGREE